MRFIATIIFFFFIASVYAQDSCRCGIFSRNVTYPKKAEQHKISGIVSVQWAASANGIWSDPVIVKSLGYGCDEEAMKAVQFMINANNLCRQKCKTKDWKEGKLSQTFQFRYTYE